MSRIIHCRINMFDAQAIIIIEENGNIIENKTTIPIDQLAEQLPAIATQYGATSIHFIGPTQYTQGIVGKMKKNLKFSHLKVSVN